METITIREACIEDAPLILRFIIDLAIYEKAQQEVKTSLAELEENLFFDHSTAHAIICLVDEKPVGFAVYFYNFSTWLGKHGLYLEDLYVSPDHRNLGAGKAILKHLANLALQENCGRFEWSVLDWNQPAIDFYHSVGAVAQDEWITYRLSGDNLAEFASS
ncbi:GNAT family N-acetyltransferase [Vibrio pectenicida]|uniref:GNAT family N-acetyltransferase n=1 Tax=Vibrio pectenicida TaxID=62763 RepID=A0A3R9FM09_9VIBR|nr:GNAT family N-acetyltransferase [Vibrio pectenicida]RSD29521.1 GNAT family N-acetyltransferase [Vibrio pectenicida]